MASDSEQNIYLRDELSVFQLLVNVYSTIRQNIVLLIVCSVFGLIISLSLHYLRPPVYESEMVVDTGLINLPRGTNLVESIQVMIEDKNYDEIANKLNISADLAKHIKKIQSSNIFQYVNDEDEIRSLKILIRVSDNTFFPQIQAGIISYLEEIPYVKERIEIRKAAFHENIDFITTKIAQISELQSNIVKLEESQNRSNLILMDPSESFRIAMELQEQLTYYKRELKLIDNFQVIREFTKTNKSASPGTLASIALGLFSGFIIGLIIVLIRVLNKASRLQETA